MTCVYGCPDARLYTGGRFCAEHAPGVAPVPDPARTLTALRSAAGIRLDATFFPTTTVLDRRAIDSGRRVSGARRRAARGDG